VRLRLPFERDASIQRPRRDLGDEVQGAGAKRLVFAKKATRRSAEKTFIKFRAGRQTIVRMVCMCGSAHAVVVTER
jgi:hypothetical protein